MAETAPGRPTTRYAQSGEVKLAYQVLGEGPPDLVFVPPQVTDVELLWNVRPWAEFHHRFAKLGRVIVFDKRGTGKSDRLTRIPDMETRMDDVRAVMDAAGSERAALIGSSEGGSLAALFAATYPERCWGLVLWGSMPRYRFAADYRGGRTEEEEREFEEYTVEHPWGDPEFMDNYVDWLLPAASAGDRQAMINMLVAGADDQAVRLLREMNMAMDIRSALPAISAPTLVIFRTKEPAPIVYGSRALADTIPGALLLELPGEGHFPFGGNSANAIAPIEQFLLDTWQGAPAEPRFDRMLATVLFTDVVDSTRLVIELGDDGWRRLIERHHAMIRLQLARFRGVELDTAGDGFFARFDGPARAIRCASAITDTVRELGIEVRTGVHTGECVLINDKVGGIAVHIGARVAGHAGPGEVLVSSTVKDLVAGSGIAFQERGPAELKGVPGEWGLFAVDREAAPA
jgi:class 3 adenylate cyclase